MKSLKDSLLSLSAAGNCGSLRRISLAACENVWGVLMKSLITLAYGSSAVGGCGACVGATAELSRGTALVSLVSVCLPDAS